MERLSLIKLTLAACIAAVFAGCHDDASTTGVVKNAEGLACPGALLACDGRCVDPGADSSNCGACGKVCAGGEVCTSGACVLTCAANLVKCADANAGLAGAYCSDVKTDVKNCGSCGAACPSGQQCESGTCTTLCATGLTPCADGQCHDLTKDSGNCGACSSAAESHACVAGSACVNGACGGTCNAGTSLCGDGSCHDLTADAMNCGGCSTSGENHACPAGARCVNGGCVASCPTGQAVCNNACTTLATDAANCGACGHTCTGSQVCTNGACAELGPFTGATSGQWIQIANAPSGASDANYSDYTPPNATELFAAANGTSTLYALDLGSGTWSTKASPPTPFAGSKYYGTAWSGSTVFAFAYDRVLAYDVPSNTWSAPLTTQTSAAASTQVTHDDSGIVYAVSQTGAILAYDTTRKALTTLATTFGAPSEPRIAWDSTSKLLIVAPDFSAPNLYAYDPATSTQRTLASPTGGKTSTMFCSDRSGHLYAGGSPTTRQLLQYSVGSNSWVAVTPAPPFINGNNGACTVSHDGWLWYADGYGAVAKIALAR